MSLGTVAQSVIPLLRLKQEDGMNPRIDASLGNITIQSFKKYFREAFGTEEVAPWLRALAALLEDPGSIPSTYRVAHNSL